MLSGEIEISGVGELLPGEIRFVDILKEEVSIGIGTDENRHDTKEGDDRDGDSSDVGKEEFFGAYGEPEFTVTAEVLVDDNPDKRERYDKTCNIGVEENIYLGDIPMEEVSVEKDDILENLSEMGKIGLHTVEGIESRKTCFSDSRSVFVFGPAPSIWVSPFLQAIFV